MIQQLCLSMINLYIHLFNVPSHYVPKEMVILCGIVHVLRTRNGIFSNSGTRDKAIFLGIFGSRYRGAQKKGDKSFEKSDKYPFILFNFIPKGYIMNT